MKCIICHTNTENIEPKTDNFPICVPCVDDKVKEIADRKAQPELIKSTTHRIADNTPQRLKPDTRCEHCLGNVAHSQWAHEDAIEEYIEREKHIDEQVTTIAKIGVSAITLTRAEGPHDLCKTWIFKTFAETSRQIIENSLTAPKGGAYDKHDFTVAFADGYEYNGRLDVQHLSYEHAEVCIAQHIKDFVQYLVATDDDKDEAIKFLATYDLKTDTIGNEEVEQLKQPAIQEVEKEKEQIQKDAQARLAERQELVAKGKELAEIWIPYDTSALIVAVQDRDNSDSTVDYHGHSKQATVVLGTSKHTRMLFSEMRKHADKIDETMHLKVKPTVDDRGEVKTNENKSWWTASDEHRENYSMGGGYYLKAGHRHDDGWHIEKMVKYGDDWNESVYIGLATRLVLS